eukprot:Transcript_6748.p1 GENE.Transcript_6748~~Transcript_6748.p1  ORF type:complete len:322 (-),score=51.33 Transcript_6748:455-1279(-)
MSGYEVLSQLMEATLEHPFELAAQQCELAAAANTAVPVFTLLDIGTANGLNTLPLAHECVSRVRSVSGKRDIAIVFEDGHWNDFGPILRLDPRATFGTGVFPSASNINFFHPTVPPGSVHLAFSSAAMHYLSTKEPPPIRDGGLHHTDATAAEQAAFASQARRDWEALLLARAAELAPGGRLVLLNFVIDAQGRFMGSTDYGASICIDLGLRAPPSRFRSPALLLSRPGRTLRRHRALGVPARDGRGRRAHERRVRGGHLARVLPDDAGAPAAV